MGHRVVCVSLVTGAGGEAIGRLVAARLGFRYIDDGIITLAAETAGLDRSIIESAEQSQGFFSTLVEAIFSRAVEVQDSGRAEPGDHPPGAQEHSVALPAEKLRGFIAHAILQIARRGQVVIVAHGASLALRGEPDVLRVHVVASRDTRVRRLSLGTTLVREDEYAKVVAESDLQREQYLARFYDVREELPTLYDLVINTDVLDVQQAAATVVAAATASPAT